MHKETLNHSSSQADFALLDAVLGQQTTAVALLRRGFAMQQCARIRRCMRRGDLFRASLILLCHKIIYHLIFLSLGDSDDGIGAI